MRLSGLMMLAAMLLGSTVVPLVIHDTQAQEGSQPNRLSSEDKDRLISDLQKQLRQADLEVEYLRNNVRELRQQLQARNVQEPNQGNAAPESAKDTLEASDLAQEFKDDPAAAKQKYHGREITINGTVEQVSRAVQNKSDTAVFEVKLQTQSGLKKVRCLLTKPAIYQTRRPEYGRWAEYELSMGGALGGEALAVKRTTKTEDHDWRTGKTRAKTLSTDSAPLLAKGQKVKIRGLCSGERINIDIQSCELVDFKFPFCDDPDQRMAPGQVNWSC